MSITGLADLAQWLQVAQSVVAIIGLPILILTLLMIWRQAQYAHHTAMSQVYQNTASDFGALQRYFMYNPEYRPYFYDGKTIAPLDPEYLRVSAIAEFLLHAVHNLTIHRKYMEEYPWYIWERSLRDIYNNCRASCMNILTGIQTRYIGYSRADRLPWMRGRPRSARMFAAYSAEQEMCWDGAKAA
jgi:hypothetical protein